MTVEEAKGVCKDRSKWKEVISAYQKETGVILCMYVTHIYIAPLIKERSSTYPYPTKWGRYNMFSSCCDKDSAFIFTTGRLPDVKPP
jgi:hypothetical protein